MLLFTKQPTSIELFLLKWVALPLMLIVLVFALINVTLDRNECARTCKERGHTDFDFAPGGRAVGESECVCKCSSVDCPPPALPKP